MKPIVVSIMTCLTALILLASLPASDPFTYSGAEEHLEQYSANWTRMSTGAGFMQIGVAANLVTATGAFVVVSRWNADTFANDQYAQVTIASPSNSQYVGPAVRLSNSAETCYLASCNDSGCGVFQDIATTLTQIGTYTGTVSPGDLIRIEAQGTLITLKRNGTIVAGPVTDSGVASGYGGIFGYGTNSAGVTSGSAWTAGNLAAGGKAIAVVY